MMGCRTGQRAHPRVCGADIGEPENYEHNPGSSPRVRGRPSGVYLFERTNTAHPRVCGADLL